MPSTRKRIAVARKQAKRSRGMRKPRKLTTKQRKKRLVARKQAKRSRGIRMPRNLSPRWDQSFLRSSMGVNDWTIAENARRSQKELFETKKKLLEMIARRKRLFS